MPIQYHTPRPPRIAHTINYVVHPPSKSTRHSPSTSVSSTNQARRPRCLMHPDAGSRVPPADVLLPNSHLLRTFCLSPSTYQINSQPSTGLRLPARPISSPARHRRLYPPISIYPSHLIQSQTMYPCMHDTSHILTPFQTPYLLLSQILIYTLPYYSLLFLHSLSHLISVSLHWFIVLFDISVFATRLFIRVHDHAFVSHESHEAMVLPNSFKGDHLQ